MLFLSALCNLSGQALTVTIHDGRPSATPENVGYSFPVTAELDVLQDVISRLEHSGIAYMLTGSFALSYYAQPRMTRDIDVVIELSGRDATSVTGVFHPEYYVSEADVSRAIAEQGMFNILHLEKVVKLDFIVRKDAPYRRQEFERRQRVTLPGFDAWIVSREDLILSKLLWAKDSLSELQLSDVSALLAGNVDRTYLERWASELSVNDLLRRSQNAGHQP